MLRENLGKVIDLVVEHNVVTLVVMLVLTGVMVVGIGQLDTESEAGADTDAFDDIDTVQKAQYIDEHYATDDNRTNRTFEQVYVWEEDGDVLSKPSLLEELRFQQALSENESVQAALHPDGMMGLSNLVATDAADDPNATLEQQIRALDNTTAAQFEQLLGRTLQDPRALRFLPADHDPESTTATDRRMLVALQTDAPSQAREDVDQTLYELSNDRSEAGFFVLNNVAQDDLQSHYVTEMMWLVLPAALVLILGVLAFTYRDLVDVIVGMTGVVLSVLWMFGLLGWLGVAAGIVSIVPVVLVSGLSIDFGFHVFNRYREERGEGEDIREPMGRGVKLVATALLLVTVTAAIGFLSNVANPLFLIRDLGISITLGVVAALLIFVTAVPALKISIDGLIERIGLDRRKQPLGHGRFLRPLLRRTVTLARRGAPVVLVVAVLVGVLGGVAWLSLDEETFQRSDGEVAEWKQQIPDPFGWETHPFVTQSSHVREVYQPASTNEAFQEPILIEDDVTSDSTLEDLQAGIEAIDEQGLLVDQQGTQPAVSPVTAMRQVAQRNPDSEFATAFRNADESGNGVPDRNLQSLYDDFFAADSETASRVIERTDGQYRSLLVKLSLNADFSNADDIVPELSDGAAIMEGDGQRTATVAGSFALQEVFLDEIIGGILLTMGIALVAIAVTLAAVFRYMHGSATLGLVVAVPIALVLGMVIGGMYLLSIPLTLLTALLMSMVIGLGVDYNIHIGDRFADELREGKRTFEALEAAVTGTGGALLGSTLTSTGAFATITLVPDAQLESFGTIVVIALLTSFLVSVLVLPSLLVLWDRYLPESVTTARTGEAIPQD